MSSCADSWHKSISAYRKRFTCGTSCTCHSWPAVCTLNALSKRRLHSSRVGAFTLMLYVIGRSFKTRTLRSLCTNACGRRFEPQLRRARQIVVRVCLMDQGGRVRVSHPAHARTGLRVWPTLFAFTRQHSAKEDRTAARADHGADSSRAGQHFREPTPAKERATRPAPAIKGRRIAQRRPRFMVEVKKTRRSGSNDRRGGRDHGSADLYRLAPGGSSPG